MGATVEFNRALIRQIPFALSVGLNAAAAKAKTEVERRIDRAFDRPTPFTRRAVATLRATKSNLSAAVIIKDAQAAYLFRQEIGGQRRPARRALVVPVGARLNQFGNLGRNALKRLLARPDVFVGTIKGVGGVWERFKSRRTGFKGVRLLIAFEPTANYKPRFGFVDTVQASVLATIADDMREAWARAAATAK